MRSTFPALAAVLALAAAVAGCGESRTGGQADTSTATPPGRGAATTATTATTAGGDTTALQRNAAQADEIVGEGPAELRARLDALKGHPVVVNQWASWCGPCRFELPFFAAAARRWEAKVAFLGIDYMDERAAAVAFLKQTPAGFPSIFDPRGAAARAIGGGRAMPTTLFLGPDGRIRHTKLGGYANAEQLQADIRRHARPAA